MFASVRILRPPADFGEGLENLEGVGIPAFEFRGEVLPCPGGGVLRRDRDHGEPPQHAYEKVPKIFVHINSPAVSRISRSSAITPPFSRSFSMRHRIRVMWAGFSPISSARSLTDSFSVSCAAFSSSFLVQDGLEPFSVFGIKMHEEFLPEVSFAPASKLILYMVLCYTIIIFNMRYPESQRTGGLS